MHSPIKCDYSCQILEPAVVSSVCITTLISRMHAYISAAWIEQGLNFEFEFGFTYANSFEWNQFKEQNRSCLQIMCTKPGKL